MTSQVISLHYYLTYVIITQQLSFSYKDWDTYLQCVYCTVFVTNVGNNTFFRQIIPAHYKTANILQAPHSYILNRYITVKTKKEVVLTKKISDQNV